MKDFLKSIGSIIAGTGILIGVFFLAIFFIKGGLSLGSTILPWLSVIMWDIFAIDLFLILPLGLFQKTRGASTIGLVISSYIYGITLWFWTLLLTYLIWGSTAVFIGLFIARVGVVPIAIIATAVNDEWVITGQIVFLLALTYGSRTLGSYFADKAD